jgi:hypothetical protein
MREFKDSVTSHDDKVETRSELPPPAAAPVAPVAPETAPVAAEPEREIQRENVS